jgi:uncharacterized protein (TIGR02001 family)
MKTVTRIISAAAATLSLAALSAPASADEFGYSLTIGGTSDYVFRGFSNSNRDPAVQGSFDVTYGLWYAGIWASNTDYPNFGGPGVPAGGVCADGSGLEAAGCPTGDIGPAEVDYYIGAKPVWGPVTFDFAFLYYTFPGQNGRTNEGDYLELKAGASVSPMKDLTLTLNNYYSPDAQWESGETYTIEGIVSYALPSWGIFSPTISGTFGSQWGYDDEYVDYGMAWGDDEYQWWNAGLSLTVEKFTMDFRYWDTALSGTANSLCDFGSSNASSFQCGPTFVFSAKVVLP